MSFLAIEYWPVSFYVIPLKPTYSPHYPVLKHCRSIVLQ